MGKVKRSKVPVMLPCVKSPFRRIELQNFLILKNRCKDRQISIGMIPRHMKISAIFAPLIQLIKIIKEMSAMPDGARCAVQVIWKGRSYSGHVFIAEKQNGKIRFIDPQPCGQNDQSDCFYYFENATVLNICKLLIYISLRII